MFRCQLLRKPPGSPARRHEPQKSNHKLVSSKRGFVPKDLQGGGDSGRHVLRGKGPNSICFVFFSGVLGGSFVLS